MLHVMHSTVSLSDYCLIQSEYSIKDAYHLMHKCYIYSGTSLNKPSKLRPDTMEKTSIIRTKILVITGVRNYCSKKCLVPSVYYREAPLHSYKECNPTIHVTLCVGEFCAATSVMLCSVNTKDQKLVGCFLKDRTFYRLLHTCLN